jgi:ABC-2 type transport system ATP-binding protein
LVTGPPILFLDEPTTGLDPSSRAAMWRVIRDLVGDGVTVLLTTQYLDEADQLAHHIVVIDHGRVIAEGTPLELKAQTGRQRLDIRLGRPAPAAPATLARFGTGPPIVSDDGRMLTLPIDDVDGIASKVVAALAGIGIDVDEVAVHRPSLDDVFFHLTGHGAQHDQDESAA